MYGHVLLPTTHITTWGPKETASQVPTNWYPEEQENPQLWWVFSPVQVPNSEGTAHQSLGLTEEASSAASALLYHALGMQELGTTEQRAGPRPSSSSHSQLLDSPFRCRDSWHRLGSQCFSTNKVKHNRHFSAVWRNCYTGMNGNCWVPSAKFYHTS